MRRSLFFVFSTVVLFWVAGATAQTNPLSNGGHAATAEPSNRTVLVLPIADPPTGEHRGIGRAIQQDILTDLTSMTQAHVIAPAFASAATEDAAAISQARQYNARYVVWGQAQVSGNQLRVTGQLLDVNDNRSLAALKATAPADNLFPLEDSLAVQAGRALPAPFGIPQPPPQTQPASQIPTATAQPLPESTTEPPYVSVSPTEPAAPYYSYTEAIPQSYYVYNPYYAYPGYWYPYPYWGWYGGVGVGFGFGYGYWPYYHYHGSYYPYHGWYGYHGGYYHGGTVVIPHGPVGGFHGGGGGFHGGGGGGHH
ncbi:MAG TPA: hypothetical protein VGI81_29455 [Tepidisphaeraceae bacterium]|jgi:TolB-like protein